MRLRLVSALLVGRMLFKRGDVIALVFGTAMRNLSIALALAMTVFGAAGSDIAIVIAVGFIVQVQFGVWTMKPDGANFWCCAEEQPLAQAAD